MSEENKATLEKANAAVAKGDYEGFLSFCTEDTTWIFIGGRTFAGKQSVRQWMAQNYTEPPDFVVERLLAVDDSIVAMGKINLKNGEGKKIRNSYCDVWRFRDGRMYELRAFVIPDDG